MAACRNQPYTAVEGYRRKGHTGWLKHKTERGGHLPPLSSPVMSLAALTVRTRPIQSSAPVAAICSIDA